LSVRGDLAAVHLEVAREDGEALDLLEPRALAVDLLDDPCHELPDARVVCERLGVAFDPLLGGPLADLTGSRVMSAAG
jgi:hypothetical protein